MKYLFLLLIFSIAFCMEKCKERNDPSCVKICDNNKKIPYSATFCHESTGVCFCDCRDVLDEKCSFDTESDCFKFCVRKNPNPQIFLYIGGECPFSNSTMCACQCSYREDYLLRKTNEV